MRPKSRQLKKEAPPAPRKVDGGPKVPDNDRQNLLIAIDIFGEETIAFAVNKSPAIKEKGCTQIQAALAEYTEINSPHKPAKMLRGCTQIIMKLVKSKIWAVYCHGIQLINSVFNNFIYKYPVSKKELTVSVREIHSELLHRGCDTNERVQDKAEATLHSMLENEKVLNTGVLQNTLIEPLPNARQNPKMALLRAELIKHVVEEKPSLVGQPPFTIQKLAVFGLSAVDNSSSAVRRIGEKILVRLYEIDPKPVRKVLPPDGRKSRKMSQNYKYLFEAFERRDKRSASSTRTQN